MVVYFNVVYTIFRHTDVEMHGLAESELEMRPLLVDIRLLAPKVKWFYYLAWITNFVQ
jgi:hypothetical protein